MPHFFISYRRSDREGRILAHTIFRELRRRYGDQCAFLDVDTRSPGLSFPVKVERALNSSDAVLVIIGPEWLKILTERLEDSRDWVRYEVAESLKRIGMPVVPICVEGVEIPRPHQLPKELKDLCSRDGAHLDPGGEDFESRLARLLSDLENVLETTRKEKEELRREEERRREEAVRLAAEKEAREKAAREEREAKWAAAAELAAQEAARAKAAAAERSAAQVAKVQKKAEPEPQKPRETLALSKPASVTKPSVTPKSGTSAMPSRPVSPVAASGAMAKPPVAEYYKHSRGFTFTGVILSFLISGPMIFVLALGYSYSLLSLPFVQLNFVLTLLYSLLTGIVTGFALKWCKVRDTGMTLLVGLATGLGAVHLSWAVWVYGYLDLFKTTGFIGLLGLAFSPARLWHLLLGINESGSWDIWDYKPTGGFLWLFWSLEAVLITALSAFIAGLTINLIHLDAVFCEVCHRKCQHQVEVAKLRNCDPAELKRHLEAKDFAFLRALGAPPSGADQSLDLSLWRCEKCGTTNTLEAWVVTETTDSEGGRTRKFALAVTNLLVTAAECDEIQRIGREAAGSTKRS